MLWFSLGALLLALPLMLNLSSRLQSEARMRAEVEQQAREVAALESQVAALQEALAHARSDAFVEAWARTHRWARPGEVPIIPADLQPTPSPWWQQFIEQAATQRER